MIVAELNYIAPPEPDLTPAVIIEQARQLVSYLREKSAEIENARCIPPEVDQKLREAGFYRMLQPKRVGGYEFDLDTFIDTMLELYRATARPAGWPASSPAHILWVCALSEEAQRAIFADGGDVRTIVPATPSGKARAVPGGYRISGRWDYCSGMSVGNWFVAVAAVEHEEKSHQPEIILFATRCSEMRAEDNWQVLGLRGTGSVSCVATEIFVPTSFTDSFPAMMFDFAAPGYGFHDNPFYKSPLVPVLWMQLAMSLIGMTRGLIDIFVRDVSLKLNAYPPFGPLKEDKKTQIALGHAIADHDIAKAALRQLAANQRLRVAQVAAGKTNEGADVQADHVVVYKIARLCVEAADELFNSAGSSIPIKSDSAFQRFYRDIKVAATHRALGFERAAENSGMVAFGLPPTTKN